MITLSGFAAGTFFSLSFSSSPSLAITASSGTGRRWVSPGRANLHKSFHSGYPPQTPLYNICLHLGVHRPSHLLFLRPPPLPPRFVNLIKAAIKQRFICLGPNLPYRHHVTTYAVHTCRMCSRPRLLPLHAAHTLTQPVPGTSSGCVSAMAGMYAPPLHTLLALAIYTLRP